jgi:hypothetical protein
MSWWFLIFFAALLWRNYKIKFWPASMKTLTNCENPSRNPLQNACCGIQEAACNSVNYSVSRRWFWFWSMLVHYYFSKLQTVIGCRHYQRLIEVSYYLWGAASIVVKTRKNRITMTHITGNSDAASSKISRITLQRQFRLYIPFLGIARPQPLFPHSCVGERFIYSQDRSTYFLQQKRQTHRGNI